jgi:hypothetical protein
LFLVILANYSTNKPGVATSVPNFPDSLEIREVFYNSMKRKIGKADLCFSILCIAQCFSTLCIAHPKKYT